MGGQECGFKSWGNCLFSWTAGKDRPAFHFVTVSAASEHSAGGPGSVSAVTSITAISWCRWLGGCNRLLPTPRSQLKGNWSPGSFLTWFQVFWTPCPFLTQHLLWQIDVCNEVNDKQLPESQLGTDRLAEAKQPLSLSPSLLNSHSESFVKMF